jgi:hypothetical protein
MSGGQCSTDDPKIDIDELETKAFRASRYGYLFPWKMGSEVFRVIASTRTKPSNASKKKLYALTAWSGIF